MNRDLLIADTSVLLNLAVIDRLDLFAEAGFDAHVPNHVVAEVKREEFRLRVQRAITDHHLSELALTELSEITAYARLSKRFGDGESATMAVAFSRRWSIAVDEKGPVRSMILEELGVESLITTPKLLTRAVRRKIIGVAEIPALRATLAQNRFALEVLEVESAG